MLSPARAAVLLAALLLPVPFLVPACSSHFPEAPPEGGAGEASFEDAGEGGEVLAPPPIDRTQGESQLAPERAACAFEAGAWPAQTIGVEYPVGSDIPINHVIVIMQENRSFDHYLGRLVAQGYYDAGDFSSGSGDAGGDAQAGS